MDTIKLVVGLIIIALSFVFIIKNPQSMMETLLKKKRVDEEKLREEYAALQAAKAEAARAEAEALNAEETDSNQ